MAKTQAKERPRGRPKAADSLPVDVILAVALKQFAVLGYDGASLRTINRELGVSHNLIYQRFGTKEDLWRAAVDYGFGGLINELHAAFDPTISEPLEQLRLSIRQFLVYSAAHPELLSLMNNEGRQDTERLRYVYETYVEPSQRPIVRLLHHLAEDGTIRPISHRAFFFLVTHGGAAPFSLVSLATLLDPTPPNDPAGIERQADLVSTVIIEGLRLAPAP
ncbi:MAG: putative transcriptional regulator, TetR [Mycobacterium sp.]|nr:putative transcriptional regulator, TetR [Mycobacterium sp.]